MSLSYLVCTVRVCLDPVVVLYCIARWSRFVSRARQSSRLPHIFRVSRGIPTLNKRRPLKHSSKLQANSTLSHKLVSPDDIFRRSCEGNIFVSEMSVPSPHSDRATRFQFCICERKIVFKLVIKKPKVKNPNFATKGAGHLTFLCTRNISLFCLFHSHSSHCCT